MRTSATISYRLFFYGEMTGRDVMLVLFSLLYCFLIYVLGGELAWRCLNLAEISGGGTLAFFYLKGAGRSSNKSLIFYSKI